MPTPVPSFYAGLGACKVARPHFSLKKWGFVGGNALHNDGWEDPNALEGWVLRLTLGKDGLREWDTVVARLDNKGIPRPDPRTPSPSGLGLGDASGGMRGTIGGARAVAPPGGVRQKLEGGGGELSSSLIGAGARESQPLASRARGAQPRRVGRACQAGDRPFRHTAPP
jgi:hypothetical protein